MRPFAEVSESNPPDAWSATPVRQVGDRLKATAGRVSEASSDAAESVRQTVTRTARAVSAQGAELASIVGDELADTAEETKARGADLMEGFAGAVAKAAEELDRTAPSMAGYFRSAGDGVESLANTLRQRDVRDLLSTANAFARRRPEVLRGAAVAAGFLVSRFLKSSKPSAQQGDTDGSARGTEDGAGPMSNHGTIQRAEVARGD